MLAWGMVRACSLTHTIPLGISTLQNRYNSQRKIDVEPVFGFMTTILGFTRMSVRGINKVKRELGFILMALNISKIVV